jgi:hypothetical protein
MVLYILDHMMVNYMLLVLENMIIINNMPTCGFIQVQPNGLKEKAAKSTQKWDPVSKRFVVCKPT